MRHHRQVMIEWLNCARKVAQENIEMAQQCQKAHCDQKARERDFQVGDKVLILLPTSANKLLTKWQGPFKIIRKAGPVDSEVYRPGHIRE